MMLLLLLNFIIGFLAHKLRPWTSEFEMRTASLLRYSIGLMLYIPLATLLFAAQFRKLKDSRPSTVAECHFSGGLLTALTLGGGVVAGYFFDKEKV